MEKEKKKKEESGIPVSFIKITAITALGIFIWIVLKISSQKVDLSFIPSNPENVKEVQVGWLLFSSFCLGYVFSKLPLKLKF
tara:strand:+ start:3291 stop:3536 length:246 start_codon:yes stop_codon:yes gene_type:complete